jgi:hypothetical protein
MGESSRQSLLPARNSPIRIASAKPAFGPRDLAKCSSFVLDGYFYWYNWVRTHKAHRLTPTMAAGLTSSPMEMSDLVAMIDTANPAPAKRGPYRKRAISA